MARTLVAFVAVISSTLPGALQTPSPRLLHFVAAITDYYDGEYVSLPVPPARHVYFVGESIDLRLSIGNRGGLAQWLNTQGLSIERAFSLSAAEQPAGAGPLRLAPLASGEIVSADAKTTVEWSRHLEIPAQGSLTFGAKIVLNPPVKPGSYTVRVVPNFAGAIEPINPLGTLVRFELRPPTSLAAQAELARRRMVRAYERDDTATADAASESLLRLYPASALAYQVKGELARRTGRTTDAIAAFDRAVELIRSGKDTLYLEHARPEAIERTVQALTQHSESLRRGRKDHR